MTSNGKAVTKPGQARLLLKTDMLVVLLCLPALPVPTLPAYPLTHPWGICRAVRLFLGLMALLRLISGPRGAHRHMAEARLPPAVGNIADRMVVTPSSVLKCTYPGNVASDPGIPVLHLVGYYVDKRDFSSTHLTLVMFQREKKKKTKN